MAEKELEEQEGQEGEDGTSNTSNFLKATARRQACGSADVIAPLQRLPRELGCRHGHGHRTRTQRRARVTRTLSRRPQAPAFLPRSPRKYITFSETTGGLAGGRVAAPGMTYEVS